MELSVVNIEGKATGDKVVLSSEVFGVEPNEHVVYLEAKSYLANKRQGTHKSKGRSEITGSTKKIKKQKGTGTARAGSIKSPLFRGGGRVFGPEPRDYSFKLNKKVRGLAKKSVLSDKAKGEKITVLDAFALDTPSTKSYAKILSNLNLASEKTLVVLGEAKDSVRLSSSNLSKSTVTTADLLTTYDVLNADSLVIEKGAVEKIETLLK